MVEHQLVRRGIVDERVLEAMREVPREVFVPPELSDRAYDDCALPIAEHQTISQPYVVALMVEALRLSPGDRVLEVGTGSGYAAAVLSRVAAEVYTIERHALLAEQAEKTLEGLGYDNTHVRIGDGSRGWSEEAPFDAIAVAAGSPRVPAALLSQLEVLGRLVLPVSTGGGGQELLLITRRGEDDYSRESLGAVRFVPLVAAEG